MYVCTHMYVLMHTNGCGGTVFQDRADTGTPAMLGLLASWVSHGEMLRSLALLRSSVRGLFKLENGVQSSEPSLLA